MHLYGAVHPASTTWAGPDRGAQPSGEPGRARGSYYARTVATTSTSTTTDRETHPGVGRLFGMLDERYPNLTQYMNRLEARPAFQAAVEL